ncbi:endonuclease/exonuclease/phosphatase family protein [Microbacterium sp.]|uniref:endonuclease/exonuclease/phosphatase family protein n=1 Tax=Microbacterium sp. TaxID=51671 RepID=UPI003F9B8488
MTTPLDAHTDAGSLRLMTWNIWCGGREVDDAGRKQIEVLDGQASDVLFLQEAWQHSAAPLAAELRMAVAQQGFDNAVLSPHAIRLIPTDTDPYATAAIIRTPIGDVLAWSVHLSPWDYGPYRHGASAGERNAVFAAEREIPGEQEREQQIGAVLSSTDRILSEVGDMPVIIAGDFNVPSTLDWDGRIRPSTDWPATRALLEAGYTDAFRAVHPDPAAAPGLTWAQIHTLEDEPRDRIDFISVRGLTVVAADHYGSAIDPDQGAGFTEHGGRNDYIPSHAGNSFPSDHLAVRAVVTH